MVGVVIEALVIQRFALADQIGVLALVPQMMGGRSEVVVAVRIGGVGRDRLSELLHRPGILTLVVHRCTLRVLAGRRPVAAAERGQQAADDRGRDQARPRHPRSPHSDGVDPVGFRIEIFNRVPVEPVVAADESQAGVLG